MRTRITKWTKLALVIAAVAGTQTGCKSGWKMPGKDMFSWSKKPTESSLAGSNPSLSVSGSSTGSGLASNGSPVSPAMRNTPTSMNTAPKSPYGGGASPSAGFGTPQGLASNANGYQTGPYMTNSSAAGRPTGYTAPSGYGSAQPMGQPNGLATNAAPMNAGGTIGMPSGLPSTNAAPPMGLASNIPPYSMPNSANQFGQPPQSQPTIAQSGFTAPSFSGSAGVPALPAGMSSTNMATLPQPSSMPNAAPQGFASNQPTMTAPAYNGAAPYRPGSTGRSTAYNFGAPQGSTAQGQTLPQSNVPHTANGLPAPQPNLYR